MNTMNVVRPLAILAVVISLFGCNFSSGSAPFIPGGSSNPAVTTPSPTPSIPSSVPTRVATSPLFIGFTFSPNFGNEPALEPEIANATAITGGQAEIKVRSVISSPANYTSAMFAQTAPAWQGSWNAAVPTYNASGTATAIAAALLTNPQTLVRVSGSVGGVQYGIFFTTAANITDAATGKLMTPAEMTQVLGLTSAPTEIGVGANLVGQAIVAGTIAGSSDVGETGAFGIGLGGAEQIILVSGHTPTTFVEVTDLNSLETQSQFTSLAQVP